MPSKYEGLPKCQDCGWKWGTQITDNCSCRPECRDNPAAHKLWVDAYKEARKIQQTENQNEQS